MNDYERIADIIHHLEKNFNKQPDLASLAKRAGLSPFHFHRLFSSWAGITPKDFIQCLTLAHVKKELLEGKSVLAATLNAGLSSPGRLHDLCVQLKAASPGEIKSRGAGWHIKVGLVNSPFGKCLIGKSPRGICYLSFPDSKKPDKAIQEIQKDWPLAEIKRDDVYIARLAKRIFNRSQKKSPAALKAFVKGTEFQVAVWRALLKIPRGKFVAYGDLAAVVGKKKAARAVGTAVGSNPIAYLIPCHRVIRETGAIGEYHWGSTRKRAIIAWESTR